MERIPLLVIVGPTASGKTRLAVDVAWRYNGEVVSADSMQIYRGMEIGTAKASAEERRGVPHHLIDVADPDENYSVADFVAAARASIADIRSRGKLPVVAGGTGLYVSSLVGNLDFGPSQRDDALREELQAVAGREGGEKLLAMLADFDPETAAKLHPNNIGRIIRAIEVYRTAGITMAEMQRRSRLKPSAYRCCKLGLSFADRSQLYERIDRRVDAMFEQGLADEVGRLLKIPGVRGSTAMQAIGYKEIARCLDGGLSPEEAREIIKRETRRYAKRQMTWFRRDEEIHWLEASQSYEIICSAAFDIIDKCGLL